MTKVVKHSTPKRSAAKRSVAKRSAAKKPSAPRKRSKAKTNWQRIAWWFVAVLFGLIVIIALSLWGLWKSDNLPTSPAEWEQAKLHLRNRWQSLPQWGTDTLPDEDCIGVDISHYQGKVDWDKLCFFYDDNNRVLHADSVRNCQSRAVDFVIAKATEGKQRTDSQYKRNREEAHAHNILFGAYHFYRVGVDAKEQAEHYKKVAQLKKGDLVPILDVEPVKDKLPTREEVLTWLQIVEQYYGVKPIIYTGAHCYNSFFYNDKRFNKYEFWIARYAEEPPEKYHLLWQITDNGRVHGIRGRVDIDVFHGTLRELQTAYTIH